MAGCWVHAWHCGGVLGAWHDDLFCFVVCRGGALTAPHPVSVTLLVPAAAPLPAHPPAHPLSHPPFPPISPCYSCAQDLAQLIYDLHQINAAAKVSVKLVAEAGIGVVASGVAKANADIIQVGGGLGVGRAGWGGGGAKGERRPSSRWVGAWVTAQRQR